MRFPPLTGKTAKRAALALVILLASLTVVAMLLLYTGLGTSIAAGFVRSRLGPNTTIGSVRGRLAGPLSIANIDHIADGVVVKIDSILLDWRLVPLLGRTLDVQDLRVVGVTVRASDSVTDAEPPTASEGPGGESLPEVKLPIRIEVPRATVEHIVMLSQNDSTTLQLDSIVAGIFAGGDSVSVRQLDLHGPTASGSIGGALRLSEWYPLEFEVDWGATVRGYSVAGSARLRGDLNRLELLHVTSEPITSELSLVVDSATTHPTFSATLSAPDFVLTDIDTALVAALVGFELTANGEPTEFRGDGSIDLSNESYGTADVRIQFSLLDENWRIDSLDVIAETFAEEMPDARFRMSAEGDTSRVSFVGTGEALEGEFSLDGSMNLSGERAWDVVVNARGLNPAFSDQTGTQWIRDVALGGRTEGVLTDSGAIGTVELLSLSGFLRETPFAASGVVQMDSDGVTVDSAIAQILGGRVEARGTVAWLSGLEWSFEALAAEVNPAPLFADSSEWHGSLGASVRASGYNAAEGQRWVARVDNVSGDLRHELVGGRATIRSEGSTMSLDTLRFDWGSIGLSGRGTLGDQLDGSVSLDAPDLSVALPGASGSVLVAATFEGARTSPKVNAELTGVALQYEQYTIGNLTGGGVLDFSTGGQFDFGLDVSSLGLFDRLVDSVGLHIFGTREEHEIDLAVAGKTGSVSASAAGGFEIWTWFGRLLETTVADSVAGIWQLANPAGVVISADSARATDPFCLNSGGASACAAGWWLNDGRWEIEADMDGVPFDRFGPLLPRSVNVDGEFDASARFRAIAPGSLLGVASATATGGAVTFDLREGQEVVNYEDAVVELVVDDTGVSAALSVGASHSDSPDSIYADFDAHAALPGFRPLIDSIGEQAIDAEMQMTISDLSWVEAFYPDLAGVEGSVHSDFSIGGTVADPRATGEATILARADVPRLGLEIRDLEIDVVGDSTGDVEFEGGFSSGSGRLLIGGTVDAVSDTVPGLRAVFTGDRVLAVNLPEAQVWVSPDFQVAAAGQDVDVTGDLEVTRAMIELRDIPAVAVPVSRDVLIVGDSTEEETPVFDVRTSVRLVLSDSVYFKGFGLTGWPSGNLLAVDAPGQATTATGQFAIRDGRYKAYGQDLNIETGRLIFAGGPVDNPGLDIRAVRQARDSVTAGLLVAGTLKTPELTVFSDPPMLQSEALAYLLLGRPISALTQTEGSYVSNAAASLGIRGGNMLAQRIANRFGIDEARIETEGSWDQASFYAGKYLSPRLYVSYGIGLFDASSLFRIRYLLSQKWTLQAETGDRTSTDINYRVERGR